MPELPEVETVRRQLTKEIKGAMIKEVVVRFGKKIEPSPMKFVATVKGKKIVGVERRAKLIRIRLSGGWNLMAHLKMTGRLLLKRARSAPSKHTHVVFKLADSRELHWEDIRKFGFLKLFDDQAVDRFLAEQGYGPEPLSRSFDWQTMAECLRRRPTSKIKPLLMEQGCIAGIGNIYATEALWSAKIHPLTLVKKIDDAHMKALHKGVVDVLKRAIPVRGSSSDAYLDIYGKPGEFVPKLNAYGREGKKCLRCQTTMKKMKIGGRGSAFCPKCQQL